MKFLRAIVLNITITTIFLAILVSVLERPSTRRMIFNNPNALSSPAIQWLIDQGVTRLGIRPMELLAGQLQPGRLLLSSADGTAYPAGLISSQTSAAGIGNGADSTDDTLFTYPVRQSMLAVNGHSMVIVGTFRTANNAHDKIAKIWFDGNALSNTSTYTNAATTGGIVVLVTRITSTTINAIAFSTSGDSPNSNFHALVTSNLTVSDLTANSVVVKITGASPTSSTASDISGFTFNVFLL